MGAVDALALDTRHYVTVVFDHAVADGRSLELLHEAVELHYQGSTPPPGMPGRYREVLESAAQPAARQRVEAFWRDQYQGWQPVRRPATEENVDVAVRRIGSDVERAAAIARAAGRSRATLASAVFAAHAHAVARFTGTGDIAVFLAADGRGGANADVFGHLTSLVPVRVRHAWDQSVAQHTANVSRTVLAVRDHLGIDVTGLDEVGAPVALADPDATAFVFQGRPTRLPVLPGLSISPLETLDLHRAGGLVTVVHRETNGSFGLTLRAAAGSALRPHLDAVTDAVDRYLDVLVHAPNTRLGADRLLAPSDVSLIEAVGDPAPPYPFIPAEQMIARRLRRSDHVAVVSDGEVRTARELHAESLRRLADLRRSGVRPGEAVIAADAAPFERIASFLAILRHRAVYVPVDPDAPKTWIDQLVRRSRAVASFAEGGLERLASAPSGRPPSSRAREAAYIIFTSGTTGSPKAVVVSRQALSNLVQGESPRFGIDSTSRVLLVAPPATDPWICHVCGALGAGAALIAANPHADESLSDAIERCQVTHAFLPAPLFATLEERDYPKLEMIATAGDHARPDAVRRLLHRRVFNIYGPTEATVTATVARLDAQCDPVPIGRPIRGTGARVVIDGAAGAPPGVGGEIVLTGAGLAEGYLDDEGATRRAFPPDPWRPGQLMYRTGDSAYLGSDGRLYLVGRIDRQVKIRGFRVEPAHLEAAARATGLCADAYAVVTSDALGARRLVLLTEGCERSDRLLTALRDRLSAHLIPHVVRDLRALPRRADGAVDAAALSDLVAETEGAAAAESADHEAPATGLAAAWRTVIGRAPRPQDDFFAAGGDSLDVLRLVREARATGTRISSADVYGHPCFADLLAAVEQATSPNHPGSPAAGTIPLGPSQRWFFRLGLPQRQRWNQQHVIRYLHLPPRAVLNGALAALLAATPILRSRIDPNGMTPLSAVPVELDYRESPLPDAEVTALLEELHSGLDPARGLVLRAAALRTPDGRGALILVAHHLVVDDWSWTAVEDRLRRLSGPDPEPGYRLGHDDGFARFAELVARETETGAFYLETQHWLTVLGSGRTSDLRTRPHALERITASVDVDARAWAQSSGVAPAAVLLAALGHALVEVEGGGASIIDLERNGRAGTQGLELVDSIGWVALHHPLRLPHGHVGAASVHELARALTEVQEAGLGYGAQRWLADVEGSVFGTRIGRFAVNVAEAGQDWADPADELLGQIRRCRVPHVGEHDRLPYEGAWTFRLDAFATSVEFVFDPDRLPREGAARLLREFSAAAATGSRRTDADAVPGNRPPGRPSPAGAIQRLMLTAARAGADVYRPKEVLLLAEPAAGRDELLRAIGDRFGRLAPFSSRFEQVAGRIFQRPLDAQPIPVERRPGGRAGALAWFDGPDALDADDVARGCAPVSLVGFEEPGEPLFLGMQVHHAVVDGHSHRRILDLLDELIGSRDPADVPVRGRAEGDFLTMRKHVAAEASLADGRPEGSEVCHTAPPPLSQLTISEAVVPAADVARSGAWARTLGVDLRAVFAAAAIASISAGGRAGRPVFLVGNGRDPDLPRSEDALGMFWYFQRVSGPDAVRAASAKRSGLAGLARLVFAESAAALRDVRRAALDWPAWLDSDGLSVNYLTESATPRRHVHVVAQRDLFHFRDQLTVNVRGDGSARLTWARLLADGACAGPGPESYLARCLAGLLEAGAP